MDPIETVVPDLIAQAKAGRSIEQLVESPVLQGLGLGKAKLCLCRAFQLSLADAGKYFAASPTWRASVSESSRVQRDVEESMLRDASEFPDVSVTIEPDEKRRQRRGS